ncbi:MAG: Xaa-Pro peptidase family protein [Candidatus Bathyarchaeia archaeon]
MLPVSSRINKIRDILAQKGIDALLVSDEKNIYYLTGFPWGFRLLIPLDGESTLFVHSVNYEAAKYAIRDAAGLRIELIRVGEKWGQKIISVIGGGGFKAVGFDRISATEYARIRDSLRTLNLECLEEAIWSLRKVKDEFELTLIRRAAELTRRGMIKAFEVIRPGLMEWEVAAEIEYEMRRLGSSGVAFDTIVCSGPESAFPHGGFGERKIEEGDLVVVDIGAKYRGYCADMTRTFIVGKPSEKQKELYDIVRRAQRLAIKHVRSGVRAKDVDEVAREYIADRGYGEYFVHNLGHGVGLDVHEPPTIGPTSEEVLSCGNIITIEPGIYIPGFGGIRIEDTVLVLEDKATNLTEISEGEELIS